MKLLDLLFGKKEEKEPEEECVIPENVLNDMERRNEETERRFQSLREEDRFDRFRKGNCDDGDLR